MSGNKVAQTDVPSRATVGGPTRELYNGHDGNLVVHSAGDGLERLIFLSPDLHTLETMDLPHDQWVTDADGGRHRIDRPTFIGTTSGHDWIVLAEGTPGSRQTYTFYSGPPLVRLGGFVSNPQQHTLSYVGEQQVALVYYTPLRAGTITIRRGDGSSWSYRGPTRDRTLNFQAWLPNGNLLVDAESRQRTHHENQLFILRPDGGRSDLAPLPKSYWLNTQAGASSLGYSSDGGRIAVRAYHQSDRCEEISDVVVARMFQLGCRPPKYRLVVFDVRAHKVILSRALAGLASGAMSPDGRHLAVLDDKKLLIYALP